MLILGSTCMLLIILGFVFGIVALIGMKKYGRKGILGRAVAGTCINGIIIFFMVIAIPTYIKAAQRAKEIHRQQTEQRQ